MIGGIITLILWWVGGFDWVFDSIECYQYDNIASQCNYYIEHNMNIETYQLWKASVIQNDAFNQEVFIVGGLLEHMCISEYEDMKYLIITYQQELGMFSFWSVY